MATYDASGKKITASMKKALIMSVNGWTAEQYRKNYDIFKNKLRAYENYRRAHGADVEVQSPQEVLYRAAKAKRREGTDYTPSLEMQRIQGFSAVSITKGRQLAQDTESAYSRRRSAAFAATTLAAFDGFIDQVPKAHAIVYGDPLLASDSEALINELTQGKPYEIGPDNQIYVDGEPVWIEKPITDPVQREEALKALAEHIHAKQKGTGEVIASGETYGSDEYGEDFDYSQWLD